MRARIIKAINSAESSSRKVRITFKESASAVDIHYLLGMEHNGIISLTLGDQAVMMAVAMSGRWEYDDNRTLVVTLTEEFDSEWFVGRMFRALENIEAI